MCYHEHIHGLFSLQRLKRAKEFSLPYLSHHQVPLTITRLFNTLPVVALTHCLLTHGLTEVHRVNDNALVLVVFIAQHVDCTRNLIPACRTRKAVNTLLVTAVLYVNDDCRVGTTHSAGLACTAFTRHHQPQRLAYHTASHA